jgi:hypothetical protein
MTKAVPVEHVRVCNVGGITGWLSGLSKTSAVQCPAVLATTAGIDPRNTQRMLLAASAAQQTTMFYRSMTGWSTRANFGFDIASNTAWGPLIRHLITLLASRGTNGD